SRSQGGATTVGLAAARHSATAGVAAARGESILAALQAGCCRWHQPAHPPCLATPFTALGDADPLPLRAGSGHRQPHPNSRRSGFGSCHGEPRGASIAKYLLLPPPSPHRPDAAALEAERRRRRARRRQRRRGGRPRAGTSLATSNPARHGTSPEPATSSGIEYGRQRSKGCSRASRLPLSSRAHCFHFLLSPSPLLDHVFLAVARLAVLWRLQSAPTPTTAGAHNSRSTAAVAAAAATAYGLHLKPTLSSRWRYVRWESGPSCLHVRRNRRRGCGDVAQHA
ncbi:unnamed protein product, partial [Urochloa humidicola]